VGRCGASTESVRPAENDEGKKTDGSHEPSSHHCVTDGDKETEPARSLADEGSTCVRYRPRPANRGALAPLCTGHKTEAGEELELLATRGLTGAGKINPRRETLNWT
jgi:hypothetical protein